MRIVVGVSAIAFAALIISVQVVVNHYAKLHSRLERLELLAACATCRRRRTTTDPPFDIFLHEDRLTEQMEASISRDGQYYEREKTRMFSDIFQWIGGRQAFWDVGANIGWYTLLARSHDVPVVAFEAMQYNLRTLNASVAVNTHFARTIVVWHVAVADVGDGRPLCIVPTNGNKDAWTTNYGNGHATAMPIDERGCAETTRQTSLDVLATTTSPPIMHAPIYLMKMDCEGCEVRALHGAANLLGDDARRPCAIVAEYLHDATMNSKDNERIIGWMSELGYDASDFASATFNARLAPPLVPGPTIAANADFSDVDELLYVWRSATDRCRQ